jgi:hypothetical protein
VLRNRRDQSVTKTETRRVEWMMTRKFESRLMHPAHSVCMLGPRLPCRPSCRRGVSGAPNLELRRSGADWANNTAS